MGITIQIPTALRVYVDNQKEVDVEGATVGHALDKLTTDYAKLRGHLFNDDGKLRSFVNVYVNEEDIRYLEKSDTELQDGDVVTIVPAVAGGVVGEMSDKKKIVNAPPIDLSKQEIERYSRHLIIPEIGVQGQKQIKAASVLCIGTGGLGSPLTMYLAAAGIGRIGLVDFDIVDTTNLQRQIIHGTKDVGRSKLESAADSLNDINPHVQVDTHETMISSDNALELMTPYDLIVDGTDNFPTRYLVNDACVLLGKPNVYGSIFRFEGQASVFWAEKGPCYRCLYPEPPPPGLVPSCAEGGVLGILPGIIGVIQATETIKLILGKGNPLIGRLLTFNALEMKFREFKLRRDPACPICGENPTVTELIDYEHFCGFGTDADQLILEQDQQVTATELKSELDGGRKPMLLDVREPHEFEICRLDHSTLIPLGELETRISELDRDQDIVAICRSGDRSGQAVKYLHEAGFKHTQNLVGGITAWANDVDPDMPKY